MNRVYLADIKTGDCFYQSESGVDVALEALEPAQWDGSWVSCMVRVVETGEAIELGYDTQAGRAYAPRLYAEPQYT